MKKYIKKTNKYKKSSSSDKSKFQKFSNKSDGILSSIYRQITHPFEQHADKQNPFGLNQIDRSIIFQSLIDSILKFATDCSDPMLWKFGEKKDIKNKTKELKNQIKDIAKQLNSLIPYESNTIRKNSLLRIYEKIPEHLVEVIEFIKCTIENYDNGVDKSLRIKGKKGLEKKKMIKQFWENTYERLYPSRMYLDDRSNTTIALSILAYITSCNYDALKDIYSKIPIQRRKEIFEGITEKISKNNQEL